MKTRVGIFIEGLSLPAKEGIAKHCIEIANFLAVQPGYKPMFVAVDRGRASLDELRNLPFDTLLVPEKTYYDPQEVTRIIKRYAFDVVQNYNPHYFATTLAPAARAIGVPSVYEVHDLEAALDFMNTDEATTAENVKMQQNALAAATVSRVMSAIDYDTLIAEDKYRVDWIPVGIEKQDTIRTPVAGRVIFIGNAAYPPNRESCRYIIDVLAPLMPEKEFHLIGRGTDVLKGGKNVIAHGEVDDLTPWLETAECGIAPVLRGSGMKIKLLTYLSAGVPSIATTVAAAGYPSTPAIRIADTPEATREMFSHMADESVVRAYFRDNFDIQTLGARIDLLYKTALSRAYAWPEVKAGTFDLAQLHWLKEDANQSFRSVADGELYVRGTPPLVVLEGLPGAGKTTILHALEQKLGNRIACIEEVVVDISEGTEACYRRNDITKSQRSKTAEGEVDLVIMDRNHTSNLAYAYAQAMTDSAAKNVYTEAEAWVEEAMNDDDLRDPDLYVFLDVAPRKSLLRRSVLSGHWGDNVFTTAVSDFYTSYFNQLPGKKVLRIDADLSTDKIIEKLLNTLTKLGYLGENDA